MHIEFLVEEPSAEAALRNLVPKILGSGVEFRVIRFQGKQDLLSRLPGLLKGYKRWIPADWRIVVLVDEDRQDCLELKAELEKAAGDAGLVTKTRASGGAGFQVLNRISIEELEAWFFGDVEALHGAYPKIPLSLGTRSKYHNPDAIQGGTWEELEKELQRKGYFHGALPRSRPQGHLCSYGPSPEPLEELSGLQGRTARNGEILPELIRHIELRFDSF